MKKKIVFISSSISFYEQFLFNLLFKLSNNYECIIITNTQNKIKKFKNLKLINVNIKRTYSIFSDLFNILKIIKYLFIFKPNLIISSSPKGGILSSISCNILLHSRIHFLTGIQWSDKDGFNKFFFKTIDRLIYLNSKKILVDSKSQIKFLHQNKFNTNKFKLIHNGSIKGVDTKIFKKNLKVKKQFFHENKLDKKKIIILFLGRFANEKGVIFFIDLINQITKVNNNIVGLLVGHDEKNIVKNYFLKNNINKDYFIIEEFSNKPELFFQASDICCIPSSREGFCQVAIEASSCQLPIIGFDVVGLQDSIINNVSGYLIKKNNKNLFKKKLLKLIKNKSLRNRLGKQGRKIVSEKYNPIEISEFLRNQIENSIK